MSQNKIHVSIKKLKTTNPTGAEGVDAGAGVGTDAGLQEETFHGHKHNISPQEKGKPKYSRWSHRSL